MLSETKLDNNNLVIASTSPDPSGPSGTNAASLTAPGAHELTLRNLALDQVSQGVIITDANGQTLFVNAGFEKMTGYQAEDFLGKNCRILQGRETDPEVRAALREAIQQAKRFKGEILNYRQDGTPFWNELSITPNFDETGQPVQFIGILREVTDRRRGQEALAESEERFQNLLRSAPAVAIQGYGFDGTVQYWNEASERFYGYTEAEAIGQNLLDLIIPPEMRPQVQAALAGVAQHGQSIPNAELELMRKDGSRITVFSSHTVVQRPGHPPEFFCIDIDLTEQKAADETLQQGRTLLSMASRIGRLGAWRVDLPDGGLTWSEEVRSIHELPPDYVPSVEDAIFFYTPESRPMIQKAFEECVLEGTPYDLELEIITAGGNRLWVRTIGEAVRGAGGEIIGAQGAFQDISESKQAQEELAQALEKQRELTQAALAGEQAKRQFLAVMSHEIRTPMNGILGFAEMVSQDPSLSPENHNSLQTIVSSGETLLRILDDILDFSRLDADRMVIEKTPFSPTNLIHDLNMLFRHQMLAKGLTFQATVAAEVPNQVKGDDGRIRQILVNLLGNAFKFTAEGGIQLTVQCLHDADGTADLEFAVRDTGPGISPEQVARIFEPFTQADSTISRRHGGTGLGLTISRRLAELMGGHLQLESAPGRGTTFFLRLALETSAGSISETISVPSIQIDPHFATDYPLRVLVVEDDKVNQKLMVMTLRKLGYQPFVAGNGEEALQIAAKEGLDCIFMDVQMPVLDGISAAKEIRSREKATSIHPTFICALTADILPEDRARGLAAGMNHYTHKPVKIREIAEVMKMAVQFRHAQNEMNEIDGP